MNKIAGQFSSIESVTGQYLLNSNINKSNETPDISFENVFRQKQSENISQKDGVKFSKHASMRLQDRNIVLTDTQNARLESGVERAREKGINESLVIVDSLAFIVNVPNNTVVTAMDQADATNNVFTNIDGAVIS